MSDQSDIGTEYEELDLMLDADQLTLYSIEYMEEAIPGWVSQPANPETILMEANGQMAGEVVAQSATVPDEAMAYLGTSIYGFPLVDGAPSRGNATITFAPTTPATTIYQGTEVVVPHPSGAAYLFETAPGAWWLWKVAARPPALSSPASTVRYRTAASAWVSSRRVRGCGDPSTSAPPRLARTRKTPLSTWPASAPTCPS